MKVHVIYEEVAVFFVPRTEWFHSNCISRSVCVAVSFFPDQRNGPSEKFFQRGFLKMKLSICITTWRGKFKLGHLITRKHRSVRAKYWFNLKILDFILCLTFWTMLHKRICKASVMVFSNRVIKSLSQKNANWIMLLFKFHHLRPKL